MAARLSLSGIRKSFGATQALRGVSLAVEPGEVHALIGENGAGKSTLMKILSGAHAADAGEIALDGVPFIPRDPHHARACGVAMIYQELTLAPHLSVAENIVLGAEPSRAGWLRRGHAREIAQRALAELGHTLDPRTLTGTLPIAEQQLVEIARALAAEPKVLIMDEPTSSLSQSDAARLFKVIARLKERGVSVIYISHFLEECQRVCDRFTVLRDGESVGAGAMADARLPEIVRLMVGREVNEIYPRTPRTPGAPVLEVRALASGKVRAATFALRAGEVFGLAGLIGAGRTETLRAIFGLDRIARGDVFVFGKNETHSSPAARLANGVGLLSENRKEEGLMLIRSVAENLTLTRPLARGGIVNHARERTAAREWMTRLDVRARGPAQAVGELSGGNQQKIALGRLLHHDAKIFLLDEPTRGIDVGSKAQIYRLIDELAAQGRAVVFVSSYLPELLGVCDTIGVMCRGELREIRAASAWSEHEIMTAAIGSN